MTAKQPLQEGFHKSENEEWEIIANHELEGVAPQTPEEIVSALYEHNKQEMQFFTTFLPNLYRTQIGG